MVSGIVAFLQCLPKLLELADRMGTWMQANNLQAWMSELEVHVDKLEKAKTSDEKLAAAQDMLGSMRKL